MINELKEFLEEYNNLLDEINEDIEGIEDMKKNKKAIKLSDVNLIDLEQDEDLYNWYFDIKNK
jgi:flagellar capping protein FliD|tara:strand:- start:88 stop:276 length:189 start_codon:yes stop_codon:yes gene_type:complete